MASFRQVIDSILGVSTFQPPGRGFGPHLDDSIVDDTREALGGQLQPLPIARLRWYLKDLERAQAEADSGYVRSAAQLCAAMRRDGVYRGLINNRMAGLIQLPKRFYGDGVASKQMANALRYKSGGRSVYDEMVPPAESKLMNKDGLELGVSIGELVPVEGRSYPVLVRLEPEFLQYRWNENRWYFQSVAGLLPITPGDGRWVMHMPGGRMTPWRGGIWPAGGRAFINKEHAILHRSNYSAKLANPARLAYAPLGATEAERKGFFQRIMAWATNTVIEMPPGWEAKLLESNGRGWDVFQEEINTCDHEYMVAIEGQIMTTTGGTGFANGEVGENQATTLTQELADAWAYTVNTQILPQFGVKHWGDVALTDPCVVEFSATKPLDQDRVTRVMSQVGAAITALNDAARPYDIKVDVEEIFTRFDVPWEEGAIEVDTSSLGEDNPEEEGESPGEEEEGEKQQESDKPTGKEE